MMSSKFSLEQVRDIIRPSESATGWRLGLAAWFMDKDHQNPVDSNGADLLENKMNANL